MGRDVEHHPAPTNGLPEAINALKDCLYGLAAESFAGALTPCAGLDDGPPVPPCKVTRKRVKSDRVGGDTGERQRVSGIGEE